MSENVLESKVMEIKRLEALIAEAQEEADNLKDELKSVMTERNTEQLAAGAFKICWKCVNSSRFDAKALQAAEPAIYSQFLKQTTTRRFTIA